jgi:hypothetical protein
MRIWLRNFVHLKWPHVTLFQKVHVFLKKYSIIISCKRFLFTKIILGDLAIKISKSNHLFLRTILHIPHCFEFISPPKPSIPTPAQRPPRKIVGITSSKSRVCLWRNLYTSLLGHESALRKLTPASAFWHPSFKSGTGPKNAGLRRLSLVPGKFFSIVSFFSFR